jgi:hypothetical protein
LGMGLSATLDYNPVSPTAEPLDPLAQFRAVADEKIRKALLEEDMKKEPEAVDLTREPDDGDGDSAPSSGKKLLPRKPPIPERKVVFF